MYQQMAFYHCRERMPSSWVLFALQLTQTRTGKVVRQADWLQCEEWLKGLQLLAWKKWLQRQYAKKSVESQLNS